MIKRKKIKEKILQLMQLKKNKKRTIILRDYICSLIRQF